MIYPTEESQPQYICIDKACLVLRTAISSGKWDSIWTNTTHFIVDTYHYTNHTVVGIVISVARLLIFFVEHIAIQPQLMDLRQILLFLLKTRMENLFSSGPLIHKSVSSLMPG